jgi:hypothetical protein
VRKTFFLIPLAALALAGYGGSPAKRVSASAFAGKPACPKASAPGWKRLANEINALVYCPAWMPRPLDAVIGGRYANGRSVDKDRSYLISFVWLDRDESRIIGEVHVNLRGYPGRTSLPVCDELLRIKGRLTHRAIPCFADARGTRHVGAIRATVYTANQGADAWHVLYAWRQNGSLYSISEHVAPPYSFTQVVRNLDRMLRNLVAIKPSA